MKTMREKFEALPEIKNKVKNLYFDVRDYLYIANNFSNSDQVADMHWVNGSWYSFQEQEKKIDEHNKKLNLFLDELKKTHNDDKDNKIDYWRGFSDCADSSIKVFLQYVGFID